MRPKVISLIAGTVVVTGGGLAALGIGGGSGKTERERLPPATEQITRSTLDSTQNVDGTLGYGGTRTVSGTKGIVTWLPRAGRTISRGGIVFKVDNVPVPLIYGSLPFYRGLSSGMKGPDVRELEENLSALGFGGSMTVDDKFSPATTAAVKTWQEQLGVEKTGVVGLGSVLVAKGKIRIGEHKKNSGDNAAGPILDYTGTAKVVTVDLDAQYQTMAKKGRQVTVSLPNGSSTRGVISSVGTVVKSTGTGPEQKQTVPMVIRLTGGKSLSSFDKTPVTVRLTVGSRKGVLTVPISALVARPGGKYGVQVVEAASTRTVPVETGMFANGRVEITGPGLTAGMNVGVPG